MKILRMFDNIKLTAKMSIIAILAFIGLALPTYHYTQLSLTGQASDEIELQGITPASAVVILKKILAEHRGLSARLFGGDETASSALNAKGNEIDKQLSQIRNYIQNATDESKLMRDLDSVVNSWKQVQSRVSGRQYDRASSFTEHSALISDSDALVSNILKFFLLSYDPSAASYHTIIANFENLPRLANSLGKVRGTAAGLLAVGTITDSQIGVIRGYLNTVKEPARDFDYNMLSASDADERFNEIRQKSSEISNKINNLIVLTNQEVLSNNDLNYSSARFFDQYSDVINALYKLHETSVDMLRNVVEERLENNNSLRRSTFMTIGGLLIISFLIGFIIVRSLNSSAKNLIGSFKKISDGDYEIDFNVKRKDEMGILEKELSILTQQLKDAAVIALEASKVKQALDSSSMCFMMSNSDREIVYMNESVAKLMEESEAEIRKELSHFNAATLIGTKIDSFHKNTEQLTSTHTTLLEMGEKSFQLNVNPIIDGDGNALGNSIEWLDMTAIFEEERRVARILEALDSSSTNIMIADANSDIIYMNRSQVEMFKSTHADLSKVLPNFDANDIIGNSVDRFDQEASHKKDLLDRLIAAQTSEITLGARYFRLTANPILSKSNERIGTVVEWLDRTIEINAEKEIAQMVSASLVGDFTRRINEENKDGFLLTMSQGLNQLVKTTESGLNEVSNVLLALSEGDLTKRVTSEYQGTFNDLKDYCNTTSTNLAGVINRIREASDTISNASSEIAQGNSDLSTRTEQQASSLEETASSMEEITSTVRLNAENANQANGLASQAAKVAGSGGELIQEVVVTMASINDSSRKISDIIGVIDGIAFQTNILALNAAVEAARAGEQGRGFAVVASEVRTLAQRSANAAKDIKDLISDSVSKVESGNSLVNQSGETMKDIVISIQRVNDIMSEIAAASAEQATGIDEVSKAITQMDEMTQQNSALVEEAAAAAESMRTQAGELTERVGTFKLDEQDVRANSMSIGHNKTPVEPMNHRATHNNWKKDTLSKQFDELPSVMSPSESRQASRKPIPAVSDEDEWESF
ncbi:MAG: methyl-accepting chemotaxis protein [Granulosicoccus sp.]|jgi:methyl-accepting chemotaxis protein